MKDESIMRDTMKTIRILGVILLVFVSLAIPALAQNETTPVATTTAPNVTVTTVPPTTAAPTAAVAVTQGKFRVGPSITLRPVTEVIEANQDGIVELFMNNPSLNDVTLTVDAQVKVPSGIHVYGESFGQGSGAGVVAGTFSVPPGTSRIITVTVKADKSARIGSHTLSFTGLYWPGEDKDNFQPLSLTYSVTVKEPSKVVPDEPKTTAAAETPKSQLPGFSAILAIFGVLTIARLLSRKI